MDDDEKGKEFLKLIDEQNTLQWNIVAKLSSLIKLMKMVIFILRFPMFTTPGFMQFAWKTSFASR